MLDVVKVSSYNWLNRIIANEEANVDIQKQIIDILRDQVKPANGCTEPIAVAIAVAKANERAKGRLININVIVSPSIYKNGFSVTIPGSTRVGNAYAAALAYAGGKAEYGLQVLKDCQSEDYAIADSIFERVTVNFDANISCVYVEATIITSEGESWAIVQGSHDNIVGFGTGEKPTLDSSILNGVNSCCKNDISQWSIAQLKAAVDSIEPKDLAFMLDGVKMNMAMAQIGLEQAPGLGIGRSIKELMADNVICDSITNRVRMQAAAATDARMGGINLPIMSSAGSGNHGITVIVPLKIIADEYGLEDDKLIKALAFAHLVTYYVKIFTGRLSPVCGCAVAAGVGAAAGITMLLGGDTQAIDGSINSMIGNLAGILCDGAKHDCALKIATSSSEATMAAIMAIKGVYMTEQNGIVVKSAEQSIRNLGSISIDGMSQADAAVLKVLI